jgi:hypothetical protein
MANARPVENPFNPTANFLERPQRFPIQNEGPAGANFTPPLKICSHWDPTMILRHVLPNQQVALPLDFRPYTKVCLEYVTSAPPEAAPQTPSDMVFPSGGEFYPPNRYSQAIDQESMLRRQDRPLGTCEADQYLPNPAGDMFNNRMLIPDRHDALNTQFISELSMPRVLLNVGPYHCRAEADARNVDRSQLLFNNATKQQRYEQAQRDPRARPLA